MIIDSSILSDSRRLARMGCRPRGHAAGGHVEGAWAPQFDALKGTPFEVAAKINVGTEEIRS